MCVGVGGLGEGVDGGQCMRHQEKRPRLTRDWRSKADGGPSGTFLITGAGVVLITRDGCGRCCPSLVPFFISAAFVCTHHLRLSVLPPRKNLAV